MHLDALFPAKNTDSASQVKISIMMEGFVRSTVVFWSSVERLLSRGAAKRTLFVNLQGA